MKRCFSIYIFFISFMVLGCKKYLDERPDKKLAVPSTINDLQALLDNSSIMNLQCPGLGEVSADNYYLTDSILQVLIAIERNAYVWDSSIYNGFSAEWSNGYHVVYYSNLALENLAKIPRTNQNENDWNNVKGSALVFRAKSFLEIAAIWAKAFDNATSESDPGIPLRLNSDFNIPSTRSSLKDTYEQIIKDLKEAVPLMAVTPLNVSRPSQPAAYALLARTYLRMHEYDSCYKYANLCLQLQEQLIDYNTISAGPFSIPKYNQEVILQSTTAFNYSNLVFFYAKVDSTLFASYDDNDLRKTLFYQPNGDGSFYFSGSYDASPYLFNGIATDEVYLMRAECLARNGNVADALNDLNSLLVTRWLSGTFIPFTATDANAALDLVLKERRKELVFRDLRWTDIKRLNKENRNIVLSRHVNNQNQVLPPNDNRYALPLPPDIVDITDMPQNPR